MSFSLCRPALLLALLLAAGCKKDSPAPAPTNTSLLTGPTWHSTDARLLLNGVEGVYTITAADAIDVKFATDGKYTSTPSSGPASGGTWAFASAETQLVETASGSPAAEPYQLFTLTSTDLTLGYTYTQAQVQHALNNNTTTPTATDQNILALVLASGAFKFPSSTPPVSSSSQITSLVFKANYKAK